METITWQDFTKVDIRVGTVLEVDDFPEAHKSAYRLLIDFGIDIGVKKSSAQITERYQKEDLIGKQVIAVVNFPKKQIGPFMSECLVTGFHSEDGSIILASSDFPVPNGTKLA